MLRERATIEQTGGSLRVGTLPTAAIAGQPALLVSALSNLLRNAAVHAPGTAVSVKATVSGKRVLIVVTDGGPGVPAADREAVFDRLARGGQARRDSAGLGLGLPLAREIARRHGGDCRITDGDGGGCTAVLELPVA
jgi:signal transduction histidine kinase